MACNNRQVHQTPRQFTEKSKAAPCSSANETQRGWQTDLCDAWHSAPCCKTERRCFRSWSKEDRYIVSWEQSNTKVVRVTVCGLGSKQTLGGITAPPFTNVW